jgi:hypothetical protein
MFVLPLTSLCPIVAATIIVSYRKPRDLRVLLFFKIHDLVTYLLIHASSHLISLLFLSYSLSYLISEISLI